ncbi:protein lifeguard 1 [Vanacampus margaritifer]
MDEANNNRNYRYGPSPLPYNPDCEQNSYTGQTYQVGKGGIAVVTPPNIYGNLVHSGGQEAAGDQRYCDQAPPVYSHGLEDSVFADSAIRRGFIKKVYLTLMIQLLVTVGIICAFLYWDPLKEWTLTYYWFSYAMMGTVTVLIVVLSCCDNIRRRVPLNFITLGLFTIAEGLMLGSVAVIFSAEGVMWAVGATALVSFSLSVFAMQSKVRCVTHSYFKNYLVFDTQLIVGDKHRKYEVSPEYVFAVLSLYLDIVLLFMFLLKLINLCR